MKRALLSVSDKTNIVWFAEQLIECGYNLISTGGTKRTLEEAGIIVTSIEEITGVPEILGGRVKTLHPMVHGGLLSRRDNPSDQTEIAANGIQNIDVICVNLYPFKHTITQANVSLLQAMEQIDIGGPSMLRSAAKNYPFVTAICDIEDYSVIIDEIRDHGDTLLATRQRLSAKVFKHTAQYDTLIAGYMREHIDGNENGPLTMSFDFVKTLRYGENPHQQARLYQSSFPNPYSLFSAEILHGKPLSYNNIQDANAALNILSEHTHPTVVALKHMNPCGVGSADTIEKAFELAYQSDPVSIFGGIIASNKTITRDMANKLSPIFLELIIAPKYDKEALAVLQRKKNLRLLRLNMSSDNNDQRTFTHVNGGVLVQDRDTHRITQEDLSCVTTVKPTPEQWHQMLFAWKVVKHVKSNAVVVTKAYQTVGIGAGQMNRVGAAKIALEWAKKYNHNNGLILASDAFLPFDDVVRLAAKYGVQAIIQPGGSIRDKDSISACNEMGISMVFTDIRHFKH